MGVPGGRPCVPADSGPAGGRACGGERRAGARASHAEARLG